MIQQNNTPRKQRTLQEKRPKLEFHPKTKAQIHPPQSNQKNKATKIPEPQKEEEQEEEYKFQIFAGGCPTTITEKDISDYFSQFGKIINIKLMMDKLTSKAIQNVYHFNQIRQLQRIYVCGF